MKKLIISLMFANVLLFAQSNETEDKPLGGKYSLQFSVGSNFNISSFEGYLFSGKIAFNKKFALRGGISYFSSNGEDDSIIQHFDMNHDIFRIDTSSIDRISSNLELNAHFLWNVIRNSDIFFYLGSGPFIHLESTKSELKDGKEERSQNIYGLYFVNGAEWFVKRNISLFAEYSFSLSHQKYTYNKNVPSMIRETEEAGTKFQSSGARLGISLYF